MGLSTRFLWLFVASFLHCETFAEQQEPLVRFLDEVHVIGNAVELQNQGFPFGQNTTYSLSADVRFKNETIAVIVDELPLSWGSKESEQKFFRFNQQKKKTKLDLLPDVVSSSSKFPFRLQHELWIDYRDLVPDNPTQLDVEVIAHRRKEVSNDGEGQPESKLIISSSPMFEIGRVDIQSATWQPKDNLYLFRRFFGYEYDSNWRYVWESEKDRIVLQRRFSQNLLPINELHVILTADARLEALNLRLQTLDDNNIVVEWHQIPKRIESDGFAQRKVRLLIGDMIAQRFPDQKEVVLRELVVFLMDEQQEVNRVRPIKQLRWMGVRKTGEEQLDDAPPDKTIRMFGSSEKEVFGNGRTRLKVNLRGFVDRLGLPFIDHSTIRVAGRLLMTPKDSERPGGLELDQIRFVNFEIDSRPWVESLGRKQLEQWGVRTDSVSVKGDELLDWPLINGYFPFTEEVEVIEDVKGAWIDINWPVQAILRDGTFVHLELTDFWEQVERVRVRAFQAGAELGSWIMAPTGSVEMTGNWGRGQDVDHVALRVFLKPEMKPVGFTKLIFFKHGYIPFDEAVEAPLSIWRTETLIPEKLSPSPDLILKIDRGELTVLFSGEEKHNNSLPRLSWVTPVAEGTSLDRKINLRYQIPWSLILAEACWLQMTVTGSGDKKLIKRLCPRGDEARLTQFYVLGHMLAELPKWAEQIEWKLLWPKEKGLRRVLEDSRLNFSVDLSSKRDLVSVREEIEMNPLLEWDGEFIFPKVVGRGLDTNGGWVDLGQVIIGDEGKTLNSKSIRFIDHPWLLLRQVSLKSNQLLSGNNVMGLLDFRPTRDESFGFSWVKWLLYLAAITLLILLWWLNRRGWLPKAVGSTLDSSFGLLKWAGSTMLVGLGWIIFDASPRMQKLIGFPASWGGNLCFWSLATVFLYAYWLLMWGGIGENAGFVVSSIAVLMTWRALVWWLHPTLMVHWPVLAETVYGGAGTPYLAGFIVILFVNIVISMLKLDLLAYQVSAAGYYMLIVGVGLEVWALSRGKGVIKMVTNPSDPRV
jgi:hypothetical protein